MRHYVHEDELAVAVEEQTLLPADVTYDKEGDAYVVLIKDVPIFEVVSIAIKTANDIKKFIPSALHRDCLTLQQRFEILALITRPGEPVTRIWKECVEEAHAVKEKKIHNKIDSHTPFNIFSLSDTTIARMHNVLKNSA